MRVDIVSLHNHHVLATSKIKVENSSKCALFCGALINLHCKPMHKACVFYHTYVHAVFCAVIGRL